MKRVAFLLLLLIVAVFAACSDTGGGQKIANQPPTVWLSAGPPEGSTGKYRVQMFWGGWDPDGEIEGYEYIVTDNATGIFNPADTVGVPWSPVAGNDSTFTFSADEPVDTLNTTHLISEFTRSHTFFIRAIDEEGARSREPAYRSFTSRTLSPTVKIDIPVHIPGKTDPAEVPAIATFRWHATDYIEDMSITQEPDSVQWALINTIGDFPGSGPNKFDAAIAYLGTEEGQKEWQPWVWYRAPQDSGKFWTTDPPMDIGTYVFAIRAKDEAGAITPVLDVNSNWCRIRVRQRNTGPLMTVTNEYLGIIQTPICSTPVSILDSPSGVPLEFRISADASAYGGEEAGYRYGWDIGDLDDPEQWEIDLTPFPPTSPDQIPSVLIPARTFFFGTHTITMEVVDNSGYCSRVEVKVNIVEFTFERNLLIVDDDETDNVGTSGWDNGGSYPNDAQHDAYWLEVASEVVGFDPEIDMIEAKLGDIPLQKLAQYKSIIWNVSSDAARQSPTEKLFQYIMHRQKNPPPGSGTSGGKVKPNILALTMAAGGHIMVAGKHPIQLVINRSLFKQTPQRFPLIWVYELDGDQVNPAPTSSDPLVGDLSFAYRDLCLETIDYGLMLPARIRKRGGGGGRVLYCPIDLFRPHGASSDRDDTMREAISVDPDFPTLTLRDEVTGPGDFYNAAAQGYDVEVYNPAYFRRNSGVQGACDYVPSTTRPCFQPIYTLGSFDTLEPTYHQPVAFWTTVYANRVSTTAGSVPARSIVFGFPPVMMKPEESKLAMDFILFDEWQLPRGTNLTAARAAAERLAASRE